MAREEIQRKGNPHWRVHPGEVLREEFLKPLHMSAYELAKRIRVPVPRVNDIVLERRGSAQIPRSGFRGFWEPPSSFGLTCKRRTKSIECWPSEVTRLIVFSRVQPRHQADGSRPNH